MPGITGIDTRELTKHLRENGNMEGKVRPIDQPSRRPPRGPGGAAAHARGARQVIVGDDKLDSIAWDDPNSRNLVAEVSIPKAVTYNPSGGVCSATRPRARWQGAPAAAPLRARRAQTPTSWC